MANVLFGLFGFVSNEASLEHLKTQLKLPQNIAILPYCGNTICQLIIFYDKA